MADALATQVAPSKKEDARAKIKTENEIALDQRTQVCSDALSQQFDVGKKYMFELAERTMARELPIYDVREKRPMRVQEFKPFRNLTFTSQVVWYGKGITTENVWSGRRNLRYYDGCESIFADEQPKEIKDIEQLMKQTKPRNFLEGKLGVYGDERMLLLYLFICSWNADSEFRTRTANQIFVPSNADKKALAESIRIDAMEEALKYAREATDKKMFIHANFLGISTEDYDSGNPLTAKELRTAYRTAASKDPQKFIESYGNKSLELKYYIDQALEKGVINNKFNPNKATWGTSNTVIYDISGLKSFEAISQALYEYSQTEAGEEFVIQLKAISE